MATAVISLNSICAGGGHVHLNLQVNGGQTRVLQFDADEIRRNFTLEEIETAAIVLARFHCMGMTRAEARNALQAGVTVTTA